MAAYPLLLGRDDELLVLLRHHAAGAVGGPQHVDDQVVRQHVQLLHVVPRHVHSARQTLPARTNQQPHVSHAHTGHLTESKPAHIRLSREIQLVTEKFVIIAFSPTVVSSTGDHV